MILLSLKERHQCHHKGPNRCEERENREGHKRLRKAGRQAKGRDYLVCPTFNVHDCEGLAVSCFLSEREGFSEPR